MQTGLPQATTESVAVSRPVSSDTPMATIESLSSFKANSV